MGVDPPRMQTGGRALYSTHKGIILADASSHS
jgi:hypothetical protein